MRAIRFITILSRLGFDRQKSSSTLSLARGTDSQRKCAIGFFRRVSVPSGVLLIGVLNTLPENNMKTTMKAGLMTLLAGSLVASSLSVTASERLDNWKVRGLTRPGDWFAKNTTEKPMTIGVSKAGQGVGKQKSTNSHAE
jgi:hypothetical protein